MRRVIVWSVLLVIVGTLLTVGALWAYQYLYARFQPVTIQRDPQAVTALLEQSSWIPVGGGGEAVYVVGYRDSAALQRYLRDEAPKLQAAGAEVRAALFARPDRDGAAQSTAAERATIAELWLTRDPALFDRWLATPVRNWTASGIESGDATLARSAVVEGSRRFAGRLGELLEDEGLEVRYPLVIWRDPQGFIKACACADTRSWAFVRDDLGAPDRVAAPGGSGDPGRPLPEGGQPYPNVPAPSDSSVPAATPPTTAPGDAGPPTSAPPAARPAPTSPTTPRTTPPRQPAPRKAPEARQQDDATFF